MEPFTDERNQIRDYLLGVPELVDNEELEMRLLSDSDFLRKFSLVKDELMEDYVSGALSEDETSRFEKHFLSTPRRVFHVDVIKGLTDKSAQRKSVVTDFSRYWPIAAALTVVILGGVLVWIITRPKQQQRLSATLEQLNDPQTVVSSQAVASITLKQVYVRGSEDRRVLAGNSKTIILLQLEIIGDTHESFRASLQTGEGVELGTVGHLRPDTEAGVRVVKVRLPADQLTPGSYQLKLEGADSSGNYQAVGLYPFQIVKS